MEAREKRWPVDPVERGGRPVQHLDQAQRRQPAGIRHLLEQGPQHGHSQVPPGLAPTELPGLVIAVEQRPGRLRHLLARPQHPRREDAVEERLHQRRPKEAGSARPLESNAEGGLQGLAHRLERMGVTDRLDACETVPRVGSQQPRQILRIRQRGTVRQRPAQVLSETGTRPAGEVARRGQQAGELLLAGSQAERLQARRPSRFVRADEHEFPHVGNEHLTVASPVPTHLVARRGEPSVVLGRLHFHDAALGQLTLERRAGSRRGRREQPDVGMPRTVVGKFDHAVDRGLQRGADSVQQAR